VSLINLRAYFIARTHARRHVASDAGVHCVIQVCDESLLTSLCHDVMTLVAAEAGGEVARMFEYQLALLLGAVDAASVSLFADQCAQRAVDYAVKVDTTDRIYTVSQTMLPP